MADAAAHESLRESKPVRSQLPLMIALALLSRLALAIAYSHWNQMFALRSWGYENISIALSLSDGQGFASPFYFPSGPTAFMAPGYPLIIAAVIRMLGAGTAAAWALIIFQILLSIATLWLMMKVAQSHFGIRAANFAGLIYAVGWPIPMAPLYIWDTCLSALMLTGAIAVAPKLETRPHFLWAGAGCALAGLVNPSLLPSLALILAWSAWRAQTVPWAAMLAFLVLFCPWPLRNYTSMHAFIPLRSNAPYELWEGNRPGTNGETDPFAGPPRNPSERARFLAEGELGYMREKRAIAVTWIATHQGEFAKLTALRVIRFWSGSSKSPGSLAPLAIGALAGLYLLRRTKRLFILFALPLITFPLPYYITHADARFQFVIDPLLAILAGYACESFFAWCARRPAPLPKLTSAAANRARPTTLRSCH
jgi:hypothetical protein